MCRVLHSFSRVVPRSGRWLGWGLLGAVAVYGCGLTQRDGAAPPAMPPSTPTAGAGGEGPAPVVAAGAGGEPACGAVVVPPVPVVDAAVSAQYRWDECGRIPPGKRSYEALYANDGSILTSDEDSAVRGYESAGAMTPTTLIDAGGAGSLVLANDGNLLLVTNATGAHVYRSRVEGQAISASSGMLEEQLNIDTASQGCGGLASFSADSKLVVAFGDAQLCAWQSADGKLVANIPLPLTISDSPTLVAVEAGTEAFILLRDNKIQRYSFAGELLEKRDLPGLTPDDARPLDAVFSADARTLVAEFRHQDRVDVLAVEVATGVVRWQTSSTEAYYPQLSISRDGFVLVSQGVGVFRIEDGRRYYDDAPSLTGTRAALSAGGSKKVIPGEPAAEWDEAQQKLLRLYGGHTRLVSALDISADGRYLASHGGTAFVWELADVFAQSVPLYWGSAPDGSWDAGLSADGSALAVSGDNVAFFQRGGAFTSSEPPPPSASINCLSADWAFSPDGCFVAGTHYGEEVLVRDAHDFSLLTTLPATNCAGGVAFSPDGAYLMTASLELFETKTWRSLWSIPLAPSTRREHVRNGENAVQFSPDGKEVVITQPADDVDETVYHSVRHDALTGITIADVPQLTGDRVRYSPEQHWLVSRNRALHVPSGTTFELAALSTEALFTPQGDIIAGEHDGSLVRYCRSSR